jgi:hypothetical protein
VSELCFRSFLLGFSIFLFERWQGKRFAQLVLLVLTASFHVGLAQGFVEVVLSERHRLPTGLSHFCGSAAGAREMLR